MVNEPYLRVLWDMKWVDEAEGAAEEGDGFQVRSR